MEKKIPNRTKIFEFGDEIACRHVWISNLMKLTKKNKKKNMLDRRLISKISTKLAKFEQMFFGSQIEVVVVEKIVWLALVKQIKEKTRHRDTIKN